MAIDYKALGAKAAAAGADQTKAQAGGGDFTPPAAGPGFCRFVGYIETGKQKSTYQGKPKVTQEAQLIFELVGKRHPPTVIDGVSHPRRITLKLNLSLNEKAGFFKLFTRMNYKQDVQHIAQLLGDGFKCEVVHDKWAGKDGKERVDATLRAADGSWTIAPPRKEDEDSETGWVDIAVPEATTPIKCFIWDHADLEQWAGLFIEGEYPERKDDKGVVTAKAKSKNVLQNRIKTAENFIGSPIHALLVAGGQAIDIPTVDDQDDEGPNEGNQSGESAPAVTASPSPQAGSTTSPTDALKGIV